MNAPRSPQPLGRGVVTSGLNLIGPFNSTETHNVTDTAITDNFRFGMRDSMSTGTTSYFDDFVAENIVEMTGRLISFDVDLSRSISLSANILRQYTESVEVHRTQTLNASV